MAVNATVYQGRSIALDKQGYLRDLEDWSEGLALHMAAEDGLTLEAGHWEIIRFLREYYQQYEVAPPVRILLRAIARRYGQDKGNSQYLYELFPYGPAKQACRYAGLPKPTGCI